MDAEKQPLNLPESARKALLRDAGFAAPEDWHPDGHFRRETPSLRPVRPIQARTNARSKSGR